MKYIRHGVRHVVRSEGFEKNVMMGMGEGNRKTGRPRTRWMDEIGLLTGMSLYALKMAVKDRATWKKLVMKVTRSRARLDEHGNISDISNYGKLRLI